MRWMLGAGLLLAALCAQSAPAQNTQPDAALEARVQAVSAELRCLVCQNQSLADSHAELALDLKKQVREQLRGGRSEAEVVSYMTERYGDFVRYRPPLRASTGLVWGGPALLVVLLAALLWRGRRSGSSTELTALEHERARLLLGGQARQAPGATSSASHGR